MSSQPSTCTKMSLENVHRRFYVSADVQREWLIEYRAAGHIDCIKIGCTFILLFGLQEPPKLVAKGLKRTGCQYEKEP